jgi:TonB family protein
MKNRILCSIFFCLAPSLGSLAQINTTLYYNGGWVLTIKDSSVYYRTCLLDTINNQFIGEVKDFTRDGKLLMTGTYQKAPKTTSATPRYQKNGIFTLYYPSGQIESKGEFRNDLRDGVWNYYYPNGKPFRQVRFVGDDFFVVSSYDSNGNLVVSNGTGEWHNVYEWYGVDHKIEVKGKLSNWKKEGEWVCSFANGEILYKEIFKGDLFQSGYYTRPDGRRKEQYYIELKNKFLPPCKLEATEKFLYDDRLTRNDYSFFSFLPKPRVYNPALDTISDDRKVFLVVDTPPEYVGGLEAMYKFISRNMRYPASARKMNIQGSVFVGFIVEPDGTVSEAAVIKGVSDDCDQEALRVVKMMPKWIPGKQNGRAVRVKFILPMKFKLGL